MDSEGRPPLELMAEVEDILGINTFAWNWPVGMGRDFRGLIDRQSRELMLFEKSAAAGSKKAIINRHPLDDAAQVPLAEDEREALLEEVELLDIAGDEFSVEDFWRRRFHRCFWLGPDQLWSRTIF